MELLRRHGYGKMRWEETVYLNVYSQNYCIPSRNFGFSHQTFAFACKNYCISQRNFGLSYKTKRLCDILCKSFVFAYTFIAFPRETLGSLAKKLKYSFFSHLILCQSQRFCEGAQSFSGKCKSFARQSKVS